MEVLVAGWKTQQSMQCICSLSLGMRLNCFKAKAMEKRRDAAPAIAIAIECLN